MTDTSWRIHFLEQQGRVGGLIELCLDLKCVCAIGLVRPSDSKGTEEDNGHPECLLSMRKGPEEPH